MNNSQKILLLLVLFLLGLSACRIQTIETSIPTATDVIAVTAIDPTSTQEVVLPTATWTPVVTPTWTHLATSTQTDTPIWTPTPTPTLVPTTAPSPTPEAVNGFIARQHLEALSETIGPRMPGLEAEAQAAEYIKATFEEIGYKVELQHFSFRTEDSERLNSANVIAIKTGSSAVEIIVGAHYDSGNEGKGADDNASGVAVMLEAAKKVFDTETPYTIRFIAFGAEENDLNGSRYYVDQMSEADLQNTIGMINLDSLIAGDKTYVYGDAGAGSMRDWILARAHEAGLELYTKTASELDNPDGTLCECSDYGPFQAAGIPFMYFEATNWNLGNKDGYTQVDPRFGNDGQIWHTKYDNIRYIDQIFPGRIDQHFNLFITLLVDTLTQYKKVK